MAVQGEALPWSDADEAHCRVIGRICTLPRQSATREFRDLTLLATMTTAGPLAVFGLGVGATPKIVAGLAALAIAALGTSVRLSQREHPRIAGPSSTSPASESRWRRAAFDLIKGRHKATVNTRATVTAGPSTRGGMWLNR